MAIDAVTAIRYLELENEQLRRDVGRLAKRLAEEGHHVRRVAQARQDAELLALWAGAGLHPSRRLALRYGLTQRRWENAIALLRLARILTGNRRWGTRDPAVIAQRLDRAAKTAIEQESAYLARHVAFRRR